jgi:hypothetical protein
MSYHGIITSSNPKKDLEFLEKEIENIGASFFGMVDVISTTVNSNVNEAAIFNAFLSKADIRLFHYSGHAGDGKLLMSDGQLSRGNIMAAMIRYTKHLDLVFLNGCATYDLVDEFLEHGANLVIATRAPVFDSVACDFSSAFYENLCQGASIRVSFERAKQKIGRAIEGRLKELNSEDDPENKEYVEILKDFEKKPIARTIRKRGDKPERIFQWSIYFKDGISDAQKTEYEEWTIKIGEANNQARAERLLHPDAGFDFLKGLGKAAVDVMPKLSEGDSRLKNFLQVRDVIKETQAWETDSATALTAALAQIVFLTLSAPFKELINFCGTSAFDPTEEAHLRQLLTYQRNLYKAFVCTAGAIMVSDFLESLVLIQEHEELTEKEGDKDHGPRKVLAESIQSSPQLKELFKELFSGNKKLDSIEFTINMMRSISLCLASARSNVAPNQKKLFHQFVTEYNGDSKGSEFDISSINLIHEIFIEIERRAIKGDLDKMDDKVLRALCDKAEHALIQMFDVFNFILAYEIITVGKVEAIRCRYKSPKTVHHELITTIRIKPTIVDYGHDFAENYCVVLISNKKNIGKYLSLSPFIINVAPFVEEDKSMLFYLNRKNAELLEYIEFNAIRDPDLKINLTSELIEEKSLELNRTVSQIYTKRDRKYKVRANARFQEVRALYFFLQKMTLDLIENHQ